MTTEFASLVGNRRVIICAGPGGVGKTTAAAAVALGAAQSGRRACVVTIDPARRLADALGLAELTNDPRQVTGVGPGELWALMLDTKTTFDAVVGRYASDPAQAEVILANRLYRNISGALGGTQEYMAMEKLYELSEDPRFDLVVVDTPPSRNALDFLDAPQRLTRFLNNRVFRLLMMPTRAGLRAVNVATQLFVRSISKVVGNEVVGDAVAFFTAFEGMEEGFRDRSALMGKLLGDPATAFVVVSAPRRDAVDEALYFSERLISASIAVDAVVVNRVIPRWGPLPALPGVTPGPLAELVTNLKDLDDVGSREEYYIASLRALTPGAIAVRIPWLEGDVHDLQSLDEVAVHLFGSPRTLSDRVLPDGVLPGGDAGGS